MTSRRDFLRYATLAAISAPALETVAQAAANLPQQDQSHLSRLKGTVLFQLDDFQGWWLEEQAYHLVGMHVERKLPVTLGIIPEHMMELNGQRKHITEHVKRWNREHREITEPAVHTFKHDDYATWTYKQQLADMRKAKGVFTALGIRTNTFIPAISWGNAATPRAIHKAGFKIGMDAQDNPYSDSKKNPLILEGGAWFEDDIPTWNFSDWEPAIDAAIEKRGYAIVGYHHFDFKHAKSEGDYAPLAKFMEDIQASGKYEFRTAEQFHRELGKKRR